MDIAEREKEKEEKRRPCPCGHSVIQPSSEAAKQSIKVHLHFLPTSQLFSFLSHTHTGGAEGQRNTFEGLSFGYVSGFDIIEISGLQ